MTIMFNEEILVDLAMIFSCTYLLGILIKGIFNYVMKGETKDD